MYKQRPSILGYAIYHFFFKKHAIEEPAAPVEPALEALPMRDMTLAELRTYNGVDDPHILIAVAERVSELKPFSCMFSDLLNFRFTMFRKAKHFMAQVHLDIIIIFKNR